MYFLLWNNCVHPLVLYLIITCFRNFVNRQPSGLSNFGKRKKGGKAVLFSLSKKYFSTSWADCREGSQISTKRIRRRTRVRQGAFHRKVIKNALVRGHFYVYYMSVLRRETHIFKKLYPITVWGLYRQSEKDGKAVLSFVY